MEQLLAAGADAVAKDAVSGELEMRDSERAGSRGNTRRVGESVLYDCCLFSLDFCV